MNNLLEKKDIRVNEKGLYIFMFKRFYFLDSNENLRYLPFEFREEEAKINFYFLLKEGQYYARKNGKIYLSVKEALEDARKKVKHLTNGESITVCASNYPSIELQSYQRTHEIVVKLQKENNQLSYLSQLNLLDKDMKMNKRNNRLLFERYEYDVEYIYSLRNNELPSHWSQINYGVSNEHLEKIEQVKKDNRIEDIVFGPKYSEYSQKLLLDTLCDKYLPILKKELNISIIPLYKLQIQDPKSAEGSYYEKDRLIMLTQNFYKNFFHEYGHHIDYRFRHDKTFEEMKNKLIRVLRETDTIEKFRLKQNDYRQSYVQYYLSRVELFARAFDSYIDLKYNTYPEKYKTSHNIFDKKDTEFFSKYIEDIIQYINELESYPISKKDK